MTSNSTESTFTCFPTPFSLYIDINQYNRGFPAEFLITKYWQEYPDLLVTLYVFGAIQFVLSILGLVMSIGRHVNPEKGLSDYLHKKHLFWLTSMWQLALSGLILFLPTQWLSNITMGMILFHSWGEYFALVLRFMLYCQKPNITPENLSLFYKWSLIVVMLTGVVFMLGGDPYIQGFISTVLVIPADFLNLFIAPILAAYWVKNYPHASLADKFSEVLRSVMSITHVIWFYGQGIIACVATVKEGAQFFIAFQVISTVVFAGTVISYGLTIKQKHEWDEPLQQFLALFACFYPPRVKESPNLRKSFMSVSLDTIESDKESASPSDLRKSFIEVSLSNMEADKESSGDSV